MSKRYPGGYLTASPVVPTATSAPGVWTLEQQYQANGAGNWPTAANYQINKSLRLRSSASAYLNRTFGSPTSGSTWTMSMWVKRGTLGAEQTLFGVFNTSTNYFLCEFLSNDTIQTFDRPSGGGTGWLVTNQVFRDTSAWYHIMLVWDTTQATSTNRQKLYVNGQQVTSFSTQTNSSQNAVSRWNFSGYNGCIGNNGNAGVYFDGYIAEVNFIDGVAWTPSAFGTTDAYGIWQPIPFTGSYGTNGFYLPFTNTTSTTTLGYDSSGNGNNWTTNNISLTSGTTYDSMYDSPTNNSSTIANYAVTNPVQANNSGALTYSNGNLTVAHGSGTTSTGGTYKALSTIAPSSGKFYMEFVLNSFYSNGASGADMAVGVTSDLSTLLSGNILSSPVAYAYYADGGNKYNNGSGSAYGSSWTTGDIIGIALDMDNGLVWFSKNGTWQASGNPASGTSPAFSGITGPTAFVFGNSTASTAFVQNFNTNYGQQPFVYTAPTGFLPLNTYNLPSSNIMVGNKVMDATTYSGNSATNVITNSGSMKPDFVWIKCRNQSGYGHELFNSVTGATNFLISNSNGAESTAANSLTSFNSNGFTVGSYGFINASGDSEIAWQWQAGQGTTSSNTNGSVTSTISSNPTAGFSVFTFNSGSSGTQTVGHGLGVYPGMIFFKDRSGGYWNLWHSAFSNPAQGYMYLDLTNALANDASQWSNTAPTSSVFTYNSGYSWTANNNLVAYAWAPVAGYSAFGSYTGNGSTDGPFIYTGFRPRYIFIKCMSTAGENSMAYDTSMNPYNASQEWLSPNLSAASNTAGGYYIDFVSNGIKIRQGGPTGNASGRTYLYAAFAENPFKIARAR